MKFLIEHRLKPVSFYDKSRQRSCCEKLPTPFIAQSFWMQFPTSARCPADLEADKLYDRVMDLMAVWDTAEKARTRR
jgi:hypothetical protein